MGGFTLVELMVALVVGLIVVLAATGFVVSVAKANSENIQVTRLTQELRAISEVTARELRRARYVADPVGLIGTNGSVERDAINLNGAGTCIGFSYDEPPDPPLPATTVSRRIYLDSSSAVWLDTSSDDCASPSGGGRLNSREVEVIDMRFVQVAPSRYDIALTGRLATAPAGSDLAELTRTFRQTVYVRSGEVD